MRRISRLKQSASGLVNALGRSQAENKFVRGENRCSLTVSNVKWIQIWTAAENIICCPFSAEYKVAVFFFLRSESIKLWSEYSVYSYFPGMSLNCNHVPNVTLTSCLGVDLVQLSLAQTFFLEEDPGCQKWMIWLGDGENHCHLKSSLNSEERGLFACFLSSCTPNLLEVMHHSFCSGRRIRSAHSLLHLEISRLKKNGKEWNNSSLMPRVQTGQQSFFINLLCVVHLQNQSLISLSLLPANDIFSMRFVMLGLWVKKVSVFLSASFTCAMWHLYESQNKCHLTKEEVVWVHPSQPAES